MPPPTVLEIQSIQDFVQYVLDHHIAPTTLVVCSSKDSFLEALQTEPRQTTNARRLWTIPTLRLLSTSSTVKLVFCPDITHLRAYLATYSFAIAKRAPESETTLRHHGALPMLAILNPIELHRPTSAFSAQGLNRTLAVAVEATYATGSKLVLAECPAMPVVTLDSAYNATTVQPYDPWNEELSILNVTTKRLGEMSVGRTVQARSVAQRWCTFEKLQNEEEF